MSSTYRPPVPKGFGKQRKWPKRIAYTIVALAVVLVGGALGAEAWIGRDARLPRIDRFAEYRPPQVTRLLAARGDLIGEIVGERRTVVEKIPPSLAQAVVEKRDPEYFTRDRLGRLDFLRALDAR